MKPSLYHQCTPRSPQLTSSHSSTAKLLIDIEIRSQNSKPTDLLRLIRTRSVECPILIQPHRVATAALQRVAVVEFFDREGGTAGVLALEGDQGGVLGVALDVTDVPGA
jgi:hypothetical protein